MEQRRALTPADEPRLAPPILAGLGLGLLGGALASKPVTRFIATRMTTGTRDVFRGGKWVAVPDTDQIAHLVPGIEKAVTMLGGSAG
ncbi:MAG: hypothetical protein EBR48_06650, partial [bacterium]|nr:hypothetical protein [Candidatus Aquidulcis frankliniae]